MPIKKGQVFYTPVLLFKKQTWLVENCFKRKEGKLFQETWVKKYFLMSSMVFSKPSICCTAKNPFCYVVTDGALALKASEGQGRKIPGKIHP